MTCGTLLGKNRELGTSGNLTQSETLSAHSEAADIQSCPLLIACADSAFDEQSSACIASNGFNTWTIWLLQSWQVDM